MYKKKGTCLFIKKGLSNSSSFPWKKIMLWGKGPGSAAHHSGGRGGGVGMPFSGWRRSVEITYLVGRTGWKDCGMDSGRFGGALTGPCFYREAGVVTGHWGYC